jgi:uncharacterized C2H2 Zn-finger protein
MLKCPECEKEYRLPTSLGVHRRHAHGIEGTSAGSAGYRKAMKRKYEKRSELATITPSKNAIQKNGHHAEAIERYPSGITETAVAVAFGRFQELCASVSFEFDVPPRSVARQLGALIARSYS